MSVFFFSCNIYTVRLQVCNAKNSLGRKRFWVKQKLFCGCKRL